LRKTERNLWLNKKKVNNDFTKYQAQTLTPSIGNGSFIWGSTFTTAIIKKILWFCGRVSACTLGHQPARVNQAIKIKDKYSHVMVLENIHKSYRGNCNK
jgi:acetylornithine/succinyldiaminopimelate/putrescine aminotransferase